MNYSAHSQSVYKHSSVTLVKAFGDKKRSYIWIHQSIFLACFVCFFDWLHELYVIFICKLASTT